MSELKITLSKSIIGSIPKHRKIVKALGLGKTNSSVIQKDNAAIRGMINKVRHLLKVEEIAAAENVGTKTAKTAPIQEEVKVEVKEEVKKVKKAAAEPKEGEETVVKKAKAPAKAKVESAE